MDAIEYRTCGCPHCGVDIEYPTHFDGKRHPCPKCSQSVRLPKSRSARATFILPAILCSVLLFAAGSSGYFFWRHTEYLKARSNVRERLAAVQSYLEASFSPSEIDQQVKFLGVSENKYRWSLTPTESAEIRAIVTELNTAHLFSFFEKLSPIIEPEKILSLVKLGHLENNPEIYTSRQAYINKQKRRELKQDQEIAARQLRSGQADPQLLIRIGETISDLNTSAAREAAPEFIDPHACRRILSEEAHSRATLILSTFDQRHP